MEEYIQKYGKQFVKELLDIALIKKHSSKEEVQELLIRHKVITKRSKQVAYNMQIYPNIEYKTEDGRFRRVVTDRYKVAITIIRSNGQTLIHIDKFIDTLNDILESDV